LLQNLDTLADAASDAILPHFRTRMDEMGALENKEAGGGFDPVTIADKAGEAAMRSLIGQHFPDHGILGEEFENLRLDAQNVDT